MKLINLILTLVDCGSQLNSSASAFFQVSCLYVLVWDKSKKREIDLSWTVSRKYTITVITLILTHGYGYFQVGQALPLYGLMCLNRQ